MTPQEAFNVMQQQIVVKIINKEYLEKWEVKNNRFTIFCIYSDNILTLIDDEYELYIELSINDITKNIKDESTFL